MILHHLICPISSIINGTGTEKQLPGLMFADYVVFSAPSRHYLEASMRKLSEL